MRSADELDLPHLPIETPEFAAGPVAYFDAARRAHPWLARCNVGFLVTEHQAMKDILGDMPARGWARFTAK